MNAPEPGRADFSDVQGGSASRAMSSTEAARPTVETYTVVAGDSLSKIAKRFYGDAARWKEIWNANREQIDNPDLIQVGWKLRIPQD